MSNATPTEQDHSVSFRTIDLSAETKRIWGAKWNAPEQAYIFSNGRVFVLRTGDSLIYSDAPVAGQSGPIQEENGNNLLLESGDTLDQDFI